MGISKNQALEDIFPLILTMTSVFDKSFDRYKEYFLNSGLSAISHNRSKASSISDILWDETEKILGNENVRNQKGSKFIIYRQYIIRIKKLDSKGRPSNIPTFQSDSFFAAELLEPSLFDSQQTERKPETVLTIGYKTNKARTEFEYPFVTSMLSRDEINWKATPFELQTQKKNVHNLPTEETEIPKRRVRPANPGKIIPDRRTAQDGK